MIRKRRGLESRESIFQILCYSGLVVTLLSSIDRCRLPRLVLHLFGNWDNMMNTAELGSGDGQEIQESLICKKNCTVSYGDCGDLEGGRIRTSPAVMMPFICTAVAVCGSFEFGACVCCRISSPSSFILGLN